MQRINLFPDPNMANTIFQCIPSLCTVDFPTVSGFRWLRATTSASGDIYAQYVLAGANLPPAGAYHIHAVCYARGSGALFRVYANVGNRYSILYETGIADDQTKTIDADITIPANATQLLIRVVPPSTVGKFILIRDILLESKSTYDTAVGGGASGFLHGRHHATQLTQAGLVMADDGHEYRQQSERHDHFGSKRVEDDNQRPEQARHDIRRQRLSARQWRFHQGGLQRARNNQLRSTRHLSDANDRRKPDGYVVQRRVRQSDRHRDEYPHLHVGRVSGEQDPARQHRIFRREHDAARLTLMGVMA